MFKTGALRLKLKNIACEKIVAQLSYVLFLSKSYFVTARKLVKLNLRSCTPFSRISRP